MHRLALTPEQEQAVFRAMDAALRTDPRSANIPMGNLARLMVATIPALKDADPTAVAIAIGRHAISAARL